MDNELAAPVKEVREHLSAVGRVEDVLLLDLDPGQRAPLGGDEITHAGERLLVPEMRLARDEPLVAGHNLVPHGSPSCARRRNPRNHPKDEGGDGDPTARFSACTWRSRIRLRSARLRPLRGVAQECHWTAYVLTRGSGKGAMNYLCLVYIEETALNAMPEGEFQAFSEEHVALDEELKKSGHSIAAEALQPVHTAMTVRVRDGRLFVTDGPFAETKEQLLGIYLIDPEIGTTPSRSPPESRRRASGASRSVPSGTCAGMSRGRRADERGRHRSPPGRLGLLRARRPVPSVGSWFASRAGQAVLTTGRHRTAAFHRASTQAIGIAPPGRTNTLPPMVSWLARRGQSGGLQAQPRCCASATFTAGRSDMRCR